MQCNGCGKRLRGSGLSVLLEGKQKTFCADCYGRIREEYDKKKNCDDCSHFDDESCELTESKLKPIPIGYKDYFVQAEKCANYTDETQNAQKTIANLEKAGRYEEDAQECEKLGGRASESLEQVKKRLEFLKSELQENSREFEQLKQQAKHYASATNFFISWSDGGQKTRIAVQNIRNRMEDINRQSRRMLFEVKSLEAEIREKEGILRLADEDERIGHSCSSCGKDISQFPKNIEHCPYCGVKL